MTNTPVATLHILNKRPEHHRFRACLDAMAPGDVLLLIENAVLALADAGVHLPEGTRALQADCVARGLVTRPGEKVELLDYLGMTHLTDRFSRLISW
ncbi:sulfurtransferase complex subunit TusB [Marinobacter lacisalsi]|uniref:Sulfurtransferase complex subunit TusB n=1 Tax=Marinobacter lacisalsi TaxID=475979 RepID=A0ABV8QL42_9GAMM